MAHLYLFLLNNTLVYFFFLLSHCPGLSPCSLCPSYWLSQGSFFFLIGQTVCHLGKCRGRFGPTCCQVTLGTWKCDNYGGSTPSNLFNFSGAVAEQCVIQTVAADDGHAERYVRLMEDAGWLMTTGRGRSTSDIYDKSVRGSRRSLDRLLTKPPSGRTTVAHNSWYFTETPEWRRDWLTFICCKYIFI